jgi:hypothetical protein
MQSIVKERLEVTVTDIRMPFVSMVNFMIKWVIATIPAMILLFFIAIGFMILARVLLGALGGIAAGLAR